MTMLHWRGSTVDLTPPHPVGLAGKTGAARPFNLVHSPLEANASLLRDANGTTVLVVALDLLYVGPDLCRHLLDLGAELGVPRDAIWLAASHTHFAMATDASKPRLGVVDEACGDWIRGRCSDLLERVAAAAPVPVRAETASVVCEANVNRRRHWPWPTLTRAGLRLGGSMVMAPDSLAHRDTELLQIRFVDAQGRCHGVWWKYACHPVALPLDTALSAEYPGQVRAGLRRVAGRADLPVVFMQGFAGDVRPWIPCTRDQRSIFERWRSGPGFGVPTLTQWQTWADTIVQGAVTAWDPARAWTPLKGPLAACALTVPLARLLEGAEQGELVLQRLALGDWLELVGGNAEFCSPWLRWHVPGRKLVHVGYLGHVFGYLPNDAQVREGGYEASGHFVAFDRDARWRSGIDVHLDSEFRRLCTMF
jgi:hypothetical protein